jgi:hypothetical protein
VVDGVEAIDGREWLSRNGFFQGLVEEVDRGVIGLAEDFQLGFVAI